MQIICSYSNPVNLGNDSWAFGSSTCDTTGTLDFASGTLNFSSATVSIGSSSLPAVYNGFTYEGLILTIFGFFGLVALLYMFFHFWIFGIKSKSQSNI